MEQGPDKVSRKRKRSIKSIYNETGLNTRRTYNVVDEHNYFRWDNEKKRRLNNKKNTNDQIISNKTQKQNSQNETSVKIEPSVKVNGVLNYASRSIETNIIPNVKSENPENVIPLFDWIDLIYLAIKNSPEEYVSCHDIQTFSRTWFPYYNNKCWIKEILSTLYYYQSYLTCSRQNMVKSCDGLWTIKDEFIDMFEAKLKYKIEKYENQIKSAMENPDKLITLLSGYSVWDLLLGLN